MPKIKTNRAAAKRFKVTGTGKLKRSKAYKRHILTKKTTKTKRNLRKAAIVDATNVKPLNGEDIMTSDRIVLLANLESPAETSKWQQFNIPFELVNGKNFDYGKLANDEYAIAIVASSSKDGDLFEGAVGSTLFIDEFILTWEE